MANNLKSSTEGADKNIQSFQRYLYKKLKALWPVDDSNFEGYGRVYKNKNDKGFVPELFVSSTEPGNTQYKALYFDKTKTKALFFFTVDDIESYDQAQGTATAKVGLVFMVNVALLQDKISHRGDEEVRNEIRKICSMGLYEFTLTGSETGFANIFKQFSGLVNKDGEIFEDRHPLYCFKMNMNLTFQPAAEVNCI